MPHALPSPHIEGDSLSYRQVSGLKLAGVSSDVGAGSGPASPGVTLEPHPSLTLLFFIRYLLGTYCVPGLRLLCAPGAALCSGVRSQPQGDAPTGTSLSSAGDLEWGKALSSPSSGSGALEGEVRGQQREGSVRGHL